MKYLILTLTLFLVTSCNEETFREQVNGAVPIASGTYHSNCIVVGVNDSEREVLVISSDGERSSQQETFLGTAHCDSGGVLGVLENASIKVSNALLAADVSYFEDSKQGFVPYYYNAQRIYVGAPAASIASGAENVFSEFIADPTTESVAIYYLQPTP